MAYLPIPTYLPTLNTERKFFQNCKILNVLYLKKSCLKVTTLCSGNVQETEEIMKLKLNIRKTLLKEPKSLE